MTAGRVVLATNAFPPLLRRLRLMTVPVFDYALISEPLTAQRESIGWAGREGFSDAGNHFIYTRTTRDGRILWGGYDAVYHYGSAIRPSYDQRPATFQVLADGFFRTFRSSRGCGFTHALGGLIDTCTRFTAFYGTAMEGRVGYALGFTGLGVAATRFAGDVVLDLLAGADTPRTRLEMVRSRPLPFPPEPFRWAGIQATTRSLARADGRTAGRTLAPRHGQARLRLRLVKDTSDVATTPWLLLDYGDVISLPYDEQVRRRDRAAARPGPDGAGGAVLGRPVHLDSGRPTAPYWSGVAGRDVSEDGGCAARRGRPRWVGAHQRGGARPHRGAAPAGARLALLSNAPTCRPRRSTRSPGRRLERVFVSARLGLVKPDPVIFEHVLEELGAPAATSPSSTTGAERRGGSALGVGPALHRRRGPARRAGLRATGLHGNRRGGVRGGVATRGPVGVAAVAGRGGQGW